MTVEQFKADLVDFVERECLDFLLVQGAGGNVSVKNQDQMLVKASGMEMSRIREEGFFVEVSMVDVRAALFSKLEESNNLPSIGRGRPSLEVYFHAIFPHRYVVHLHPIDLLAVLVRCESSACIASIFDVDEDKVVEYAKPGIDLARLISSKVRIDDVKSTVVLLRNHGVIIAAESIPEVEAQLTAVLKVARQQCDKVAFSSSEPVDSPDSRWQLVNDVCVQQIALNQVALKRAQEHWALYPDHVVFLGPTAPIVDKPRAFELDLTAFRGPYEDVLIVSGAGVYAREDILCTKHEQLRCFAEVLARQGKSRALLSLTECETSALVNWEAEKYRLHLNSDGGS